MHISNAFLFGLLFGANMYFTVWLYILWAKLWSIEILRISFASGAIPKSAPTYIVKGTKLEVDYVPYIAGVTYLGYQQKEYEKLYEADKPFAFRHQSGIRRFVIMATPSLQVFAVVCLCIHFFYTDSGFMDNLCTICLYLKQLGLYCLNIHHDKTLIPISHFDRRSLFAFIFCYYGLMFLVLTPLNKFFEYLGSKENKMFKWFAYLSIAICFAFCWLNVPYCISSLLSMSTGRIIFDLFQFVIAIYICAYVSAALIYLFLSYSASLRYTTDKTKSSSG